MGAARRLYASPELILRESPILPMFWREPDDRPYSRGVVIRCRPVQIEQDRAGNVVFTTRTVPIRSGQPSQFSIPPEQFRSILARLEEDLELQLSKYLLSQK